MKTELCRKLLRAAQDARKLAYAPYSSFTVGAALLTSTGKIYTGCNIENASFGATNCAERTALFKAVSEGERSFAAIALIGRKINTESAPTVCAPCGICRQVLSEFCDNSLTVIMSADGTNYQEATLAELLPLSFGGEML